MRNNRRVLSHSDVPLTRRHDVAVLDLDGVVYVGPEAVPGAAEALGAARAEGMHLAFVTNNAARTPDTVAAHLTGLGIAADESDVVTSAQAAARVLSKQLPAGAEVYLIGGEGLEVALKERGLVPVTTRSEAVAAVAQGYGPEMPWRQVVAGAILVADGLPWVASNTDMTIPTTHGRGPGNGTLVELVARFAGREPVVAGKPEAPLFEETLLRVGGERPLVVGDRVDTDIEGARGLEWDSLLVFTGVTGVAELVAILPESRPSFVGAGLSSLLTPHEVPELVGTTSSLGGWTAAVDDGRLSVSGEGGVDEWWRVVATSAWRHLDAVGAPVNVEGLQPPR